MPHHPTSHPAGARKRWKLDHAGVMLLAAVCTLVFGEPLFVHAIALLSFARLIAMHRQAWTPRGAFGLANSVTGLRACLLAATSVFASQVGLVFVFGLLFVFILDGLDGKLARATGSNSEFGACFDLEVDAWLVLILGVELYLRGHFGAWILIPGALRYVYVIALALYPPRRHDEPRSLFGRLAFSFIVLSSLATLAFPLSVLAKTACVLTSILIMYSFSRSFRYAYGSSEENPSATSSQI